MFSHSTKPLCLICCETVVLIKRWNVKQHNKTKHGSFEEIYPQKSDESARQREWHLRQDLSYCQAISLTRKGRTKECEKKSKGKELLKALFAPFIKEAFFN